RDRRRGAHPVFRGDEKRSARGEARDRLSPLNEGTMDESNDMTATAVEEAPAEKPEKPKRAPRAKKANGSAAAAAPPPPVVEVEDPPAPVAAAEDDREPASEALASRETLDIRVLKEMKLPDL